LSKEILKFSFTSPFVKTASYNIKQNLFIVEINFLSFLQLFNVSDVSSIICIMALI
jgi:hypothetical protein